MHPYSPSTGPGGSTVYIKLEGSLTTTVSEAYYTKYINYQQNKKSNNEPLPEELDFAKVKIHISLNNEDYIHHKNDIEDIIFEYVKNGTLHGYTTVSTDSIGTIQDIEKAKDELKKYEENLKKNPEEGNQINTYLALTTYLGKLPFESELSKVGDDIEQDLQNCKRNLNRNQFTLEIPKNYNQQKIAQLCQELDAYMRNKNLTPGEKSDVALSLSSHINARLEYFEQGNDTKRIDAIPNKDDTPERRKNAITQLEANALYTYLQKNLNSSPSYGKAFLAAAAGIALLGGAIAFGASGVGLPIGAAMIAAAIKAFIVAIGVVAGTAFFLYGAGNIAQKTTESCCYSRP